MRPAGFEGGGLGSPDGPGGAGKPPRKGPVPLKTGLGLLLALCALTWQAGARAQLGSGPPFGTSPGPFASPAPGMQPFASPGAPPFGNPFASPSESPLFSPAGSTPQPGLSPGFAPVPGSSPGANLPGAPQPFTQPATYSNQVHVKADVVTYDRKTKVATARGNVDVTYQNSHISTEFLELDQASGSVRTSQPFILTQTSPQGNQTVKGISLVYGLKTHDATVSDVFMSVPAPVGGQTMFVSGDELSSQGNKVYHFKDGTFTTCDEVLEQKPPHYDVKSQYLTVAPNSYAMGWNSWIYVNNTRLLWIPFFWLPLRKHKTSLVFGQNDIEGYYVKTTMGYQLDPDNTGTLYLNGMQKKGLGLGFAHTWSLLPYQMTNIDAYGLAMPDPDPSWLYIHGLDASNRHPFSDYLWHFRHQQRLLDTMTLDLSAEDYNIYSLQVAQGIIGSNLKVSGLGPGQSVDDYLKGVDIRDDHAKNSILVTDQRGGVSYDVSRSWNEDRTAQGTTAPVPGSVRTTNPTSTQYGGDVKWTHDQTNLDFSSKYQAQTPYVYPTATPAPGQTPAPAPTPYTPTTTTFDNTLHVDRKLPGDISASWDNHYVHNITPGLAGSPTQETGELEEKLDFSKDLGWANADLNVDKLFVFQPFFYTFNPNAVASSSLLVNRGFLEKLPELTLTTKPILPDIEPFTISAVAGRYFEFASYKTAAEVAAAPALKPYQNAISRLDTTLALASKPHDLGLNSTLDFGGSQFDQRYYSTGDSAYSTTLKSSLVTQYTDWLKQTLTYSNLIPGGDPASSPNADTHVSTTPFKWDALSLQKATTLTGNEHFSFGSNLTWDNNSGYDYVNQRYSDYTTSLNLTPDPRMTWTLSTGYHFPEVPYFALNRATRPDGTRTIGHWQALSSGLTLRSTDNAFGGQWGLAQINSGAQLQTNINWNPDTGKISALTANVYAVFGNRWQNHWQIYAGTSYDLIQPGEPGYDASHPDRRVFHILNAGIARDLHDFILSFDYSRQSDTVQTYTLRLTMPAFGQDILNLSNNGSTPNITGGIGNMIGTGTSPASGL